MNILGIGPGELILILIILLLVVGPERLPVLARNGGKMLVQLRNWVQRSPDAAMVLRARQEIEAELAQLRASLAEVQSARNEVIEAAKQVNTIVNEDIIGATKEVLTTASNEISSTTGAVQGILNGQTVPRSNVPGTVAPAPDAESPAAGSPAPAPEPAVAVNEPVVSEQGLILPETMRDEQPVPAAPDDMARLSARIEALAEELRALQQELRRRDLLDPGWQPHEANIAPQMEPPVVVAVDETREQG